MKNKRMFEIANAADTSDIKKVVREHFLDWCDINGRTATNPLTIQEWFEEEWEDI